MSTSFLRSLLTTSLDADIFWVFNYNLHKGASICDIQGLVVHLYNKKVLRYGEQDVVFVNWVWVIVEVYLLSTIYLSLLIFFQVPLRVQKAVEYEKPITSILHPDLKHSTSCRDVTSCFYHIKDLWNQMGWQSVQNNRSLLAASVDVSDF